MDKIIGMVRNNPELRKQLEAETERLVKEKEAAGKKNTGGSQWELFWNTVFKAGTQGL